MHVDVSSSVRSFQGLFAGEKFHAEGLGVVCGLEMAKPSVLVRIAVGIHGEQDEHGQPEAEHHENADGGTADLSFGRILPPVIGLVQTQVLLHLLIVEHFLI